MHTGRDFPDLRVHVDRLHAGIRFVATSREVGASDGAFARGNLAVHVGDDPVAVARNRAALARVLSAPQGLAFIGAAHGAEVVWASRPGTYEGVDGLITASEGLGVVAMGADCAVVGLGALREDGTPIVAVAHCGWRGLVADILGAVVNAVREAGGRDLVAVRGPAICAACYRVDVDRIAQVRRECSPAVVQASVVQLASDEHAFGLDIGAGARARLRELDVRVVTEFGCTAEDPRWFSHRRATAQDGPDASTGRHALAMIIDGGLARSVEQEGSHDDR